mmetsp:Transcript_1849/g.3781  ORF Transcript_1849/g.3781 Transcript_1849/m.3781 type:complete len:250 (-) Transcript_1849:1930-2679(-)
MSDADDFLDYDQYINVECQLPKDNETLSAAKIIGQALDEQGNVVGNYHANPVLDTRVYDVLFPDGAVKQYAANIIAKHMYSQCDNEGYQHQILNCILDVRKNNTALCGDDGFIINKHDRKIPKKTTKGWFFNVRWKDSSDSWVPLKDIKESIPVEVATFATTQGIEKEPAFSWWVAYIIKKSKHSIASVQHQTKKTSHKYGISVPTSIADVYRLDIQNGNAYWRDTIARNMKSINVAIDILHNATKPPP